MEGKITDSIERKSDALKTVDMIEIEFSKYKPNSIIMRTLLNWLQFDISFIQTNPNEPPSKQRIDRDPEGIKEVE